MRIVANCRRLFLHQLYFFEEILSRNNSNNLETFWLLSNSSCWHLNSINYSDHSSARQHFLNFEQTSSNYGLYLAPQFAFIWCLIHHFFVSVASAIEAFKSREVIHPSFMQKMTGSERQFSNLRCCSCSLKLWLTLRYGAWVIYGSKDLPLFRLKSAW